MRNVLYRPPDQRSAGGNPHDHGLARRLLVGAGVGVLVAIPFTLLLLLVESAWEPLENLDRTVADNLNQAAQGHSARVHALEVLAIGERSLARDEARGEARGLERAQHGFQPLRGLGMSLAHFMQDAVGMREECGRHPAGFYRRFRMPGA